MNKQKEELLALQEQIKKEQNDVIQQRELLYRKLEALRKEGIILSPQHTVVNIGANKTSSQEQATNDLLADTNESTVISSYISSSGSSSPVSHIRSKNNVTSINISATKEIPQQLPVHLISTTNLLTRRNPVQNSVIVKQQLPLKLAINSSSNSPPMAHSAPSTSSPALVHAANAQSNATTTPTTNSSAPTNGVFKHHMNSASADVLQQILPMKLVEDSKKQNRIAKNPIHSEPFFSLPTTSSTTISTQKVSNSKNETSTAKSLHKSFSSLNIIPNDSSFHFRAGSSPAVIPLVKDNINIIDESSIITLSSDTDNECDGNGNNQEIFC